MHHTDHPSNCKRGGVCIFYKARLLLRVLLELDLNSLSSSNPFLIVMIGDFNAKSKQWCKIDKTSFEGSQIQLLTSKFGLSQITTEPTHILENSSPV